MKNMNYYFLKITLLSKQFKMKFNSHEKLNNPDYREITRVEEKIQSMSNALSHSLGIFPNWLILVTNLVYIISGEP